MANAGESTFLLQELGKERDGVGSDCVGILHVDINAKSWHHPQGTAACDKPPAALCVSGY